MVIFAEDEMVFALMRFREDRTMDAASWADRTPKPATRRIVK
jgi:hypothetical protein